MTHQLEQGGIGEPQANGVRLILLGWCLWLLGGWAVALNIDSATPAVRWMVFVSLIGLMAVWPAVRLSQGGGRATAGGGTSGGSGVTSRTLTGDGGVLLADWVAMQLVLQTVVWPLGLVARWRWEQSAWLAAALAGWSLAAGLLVAIGRSRPSGVLRTAAMAACLLLLLGGPILHWAAQRAAIPPLWRLRAGFSPVETVWALSAPPTDFHPDRWAGTVMGVLIAAVVGWSLWLLLTALATTRRSGVG